VGPDFAGARTAGQLTKNTFEGIDRHIRAFSTESIGPFDTMVRKLRRSASDFALSYDTPSGAPGPPMALWSWTIVRMLLEQVGNG
jgi:hypothetical protein